MIDSASLGLTAAFGYGVAGNFAGHLEQAGEAADFARVAPVTPEAPRAVFPWYIPSPAPGTPDFLHVFPISSDRLTLPEGTAVNLQIEPEAGAVAEIAYDDAGLVTSITPRYLGAFNDCSIRREGAVKISHKKNWGPASKGVAAQFFDIGDLTPDGPTATLRLVCFLEGSDGAEHAYGVDSPLLGYSYYGEVLLDWIVERLANQKGSPDTPLEDVGALMVAAGRPDHALIGIGATRYTPLGESTYLQPGDRAVVRVYDTESDAKSELQQRVSQR